ncbi:hypothetical protein WMZ97_00945 [Lentibacillus sp. N15]|uniref:hypothetical protein n=1 Tax=Lentibacillus songyuanensis TaxID=3136161 RepID=UPI0031B9C45E
MFSEKEKLMANECALTVSMIDSGFDALSKANISQKGLYYQALFSLSIGIERLLKIILISEYRAQNDGHFPNSNRIRKYGHKLDTLLKKADIKFFDEIDNSIINLLNEFANTSRYYNVDIMSKGNSNNKNPLAEWERIKGLIIERYKENITEFENRQLFDELHKNDIFMFHNLNGEFIDKAGNLLSELKINHQAQHLAVKHIFNIVVNMVEYLLDIRSRKYLLPDQLDFFGKYNENVLSIIDLEEIDWLSPVW